MYRVDEWQGDSVHREATGGEIDPEFRSQQTTITGDTLCQVNKYSLSTLI